VPFIADLKPSGKYVMEDVHKVGGTPAVMKYLHAKGLIDGTPLTCTGALTFVVFLVVGGGEMGVMVAIGCLFWWRSLCFCLCRPKTNPTPPTQTNKQTNRKP
jgi:hypothetical protein